MFTMPLETAPSWMRRAIRDIDDGHIAIFRSQDGRDYADRQVMGAPTDWWYVLEDSGLIQPPAAFGRWTRTRLQQTL